MSTADPKHSWELLHHIANRRKESICRQCGLVQVSENSGGGWSSYYHRPGTKGSVTKCRPCPGPGHGTHIWKWDGKSPFRVCDTCGTKYLKALPMEGVVVVAFQKKGSRAWVFEYLPCEQEKKDG